MLLELFYSVLLHGGKLRTRTGKVSCSCGLCGIQAVRSSCCLVSSPCSYYCPRGLGWFMWKGIKRLESLFAHQTQSFIECM